MERESTSTSSRRREAIANVASEEAARQLNKENNERGHPVIQKGGSTPSVVHKGHVCVHSTHTAEKKERKKGSKIG